MLWAMRPRMAFVADDQVLHVVRLKPALGMRLRLAIVTDDYALHVVNLRHALGHYHGVEEKVRVHHGDLAHG